MVNFAIEMAVGAFICVCIRYKRIPPLVLALVQIIIAIWLETSVMHEAGFSTQLRIDELSIVMKFIIGTVGSGICVYALGYMKDFQSHHAIRRIVAPVLCPHVRLPCGHVQHRVFRQHVASTRLGKSPRCASFLLIGFTKTEEAINNAFRRIVMNMLGASLSHRHCVHGPQRASLVFSEFLMAGAQSAARRPLRCSQFLLSLLAFAGMTKAAQMPFHTWLLGAMVAPTLTSALLHSSTMVKAGVFLLIKLSPLFLAFPIASGMVVLVGGFTFLFCSFLAISQSNAKRVLAYSTIANLGRSPPAPASAPRSGMGYIFLVIFHAVAKSLLFLCVGTAEHHIGSRNIEDMDELFERMPRLARFMMLGIMCMFIALFGMLVSNGRRSSPLRPRVRSSLLVLLAFGSAATFMFWAKWLGKLAGIAAHRENVETIVYKSEWSAIVLMAILVVAACINMPVLSAYFVEPYLLSTYGAYGASIGLDNMVIMAVIVAFIAVVLFGTLGNSKARTVPVYMAGITVDSAKRVFRGSLGDSREATSRNWYLEGIFGEARLDKPATVLTAAIIVVCIAATLFAGSYFVNSFSLPMYFQTMSFNEGIFSTLIGMVVFVVLGPVVGCLLAGIDRKVSARMQGRVGPPLLQPYYDVRKLIAKDNVSVNSVEAPISPALDLHPYRGRRVLRRWKLPDVRIPRDAFRAVLHPCCVLFPFSLCRDRR
ncbi:MAG: proton-conducting transporter membrane subunit [Eggerthellaceae bacterium]